MSMHCDHCRFFQPNPPASGPSVMTFCGGEIRGGGTCRRNPPVISNESRMAIFPIVPNDCWCGEYQPAQKESMP
jgi:hypothetical protein